MKIARCVWGGADGKVPAVTRATRWRPTPLGGGLTEKYLRQREQLAGGLPYQAAIYALLRGGVPPPVRGATWSHAFVQAEFVRLLIDRHKRYPSELRGTIDQCRALGLIGDCETTAVSRTQCQRSVRRAREFIDRITVQEKGLT